LEKVSASFFLPAQYLPGTIPEIMDFDFHPAFGKIAAKAPFELLSQSIPDCIR